MSEISKAIAVMTLADFPKHVSLSLEHNPHRLYYENVAQYLQQALNPPDFPDEHERLACIDTNELWVLQWWPNNPVGHHKIAASTMLRVLQEAKEQE